MGSAASMDLSSMDEKDARRAGIDPVSLTPPNHASLSNGPPAVFCWYRLWRCGGGLIPVRCPDSGQARHVSFLPPLALS